MINSDTKLFAIAGKPVLHSKSPDIFNGLFKAMNFNGRYLKISAKDASGINCLSKLLGLSGINITAPYKETFMEFATHIDNASEHIGACNTALFNENKTEVFNFDWIGVINSLREKIGDLKDKKALIIGAGGAAKAAVFGLLNSGVNVTITNRTLKNAELLSEKFPIHIITSENINSEISQFDLIVNTLEFPFSIFDFSLISKKQIVFDANYKNSIFYDHCLLNNITMINGFPWLIHQATFAFKTFTGIDVSSDFITEILSKESPPNKNIIAFTGLSGVGKTSISKMLADSISWKFLDVDREIEKLCGMTVSEIFMHYGEDYFRKAETEMLLSLKGEEKLVLSLGGGLIMNELNRKWLKENALVVMLMADFETIAERINSDNRPLVNPKSKIENLREMFQNRKKHYLESADLILYNQDVSPEELILILKQEVLKF